MCFQPCSPCEKCISNVLKLISLHDKLCIINSNWVQFSVGRVFDRFKSLISCIPLLLPDKRQKKLIPGCDWIKLHLKYAHFKPMQLHIVCTSYTYKIIVLKYIHKTHAIAHQWEEVWVTFVQRLYCTYAVIRLFYCFWFCLDTIQFNPIQFNSPVYSDRLVPYKNSHKIQKYTKIKNWISQPFCLLNAMQHTYTMKHIKVSKGAYEFNNYPDFIPIEIWNWPLLFPYFD